MYGQGSVDLVRVQFLNAQAALVQASVKSRGNSQCTTDDGADAGQEASEGLGAGLAVDDLHRGNVIVEKDTGETTRSVQSLLVSLGLVAAAPKRALVRGDRVLVGFNASLGSVCEAVRTERRLVIGTVDRRRESGVPSQGQVRGRNHLEEVHEIECGLIGRLLGVVERVGVVVIGPLPAACQLSGKLRSKPELVDLVGHAVLVFGGCPRHEVVLDVMRMQVHVCEAATRCNVEVADHLINPQNTFDPTAFAALGLKFLAVSFPLTLLNVLADSKRPFLGRVCFSHFIAGTAAAGLDRILGCHCSVAFTTVAGVEVGGGICRRVPETGGVSSMIKY